MTGREKLMLAVCGVMGLTLARDAMAGAYNYGTGEAYFQDFNSLASGPTIGTTASWTDGAPTAFMTGWYAAKTVQALPLPNNALANYVVGDGSSNSGQVYSFGALNATDRALGSVGSGTPGTIYYGMQFINNTPDTLSTFTISYTGEQYRATGVTGTGSQPTTVVNTQAFSYSTSATSIFATTGYNPATALDFKAPDAGSPPAWPGAAAGDGAVNGNDATFQRNVNGTVTITGGWAPGTALWIRWSDINDAGNDQGLAIDDFHFSAAPHVAVHNGTTLSVGGSKTAPVQDFGRVVAGVNSPGATVNLANSGPVSTTFVDASTDGSTVTPPSGSVAPGGTTPLTVKIAAGANPAPPGVGTFVGSDISRQVVIQNTGEDNDANVVIPMKLHSVLNRFVDNYDNVNALQGGPDVPVDFGKMLIGSTKSVTTALATVNKNTNDYSSNTLTTVTLLGSTTVTDGLIGGTTLPTAVAKGSVAAGTGDVTFDDGSDIATDRLMTVTPLQSGVIKFNNAGTGERAPQFLSLPLRQDDTAVGASGDARLYIQGDFYAPAAPVGNASPVAPGGTVTLTNTAPTGDGAAGKRLGADILGTSFNQSGWSVSGLPATIGSAFAQHTTVSGTVTSTISAQISTATGSIAFDPAGKLNGTYGGTLSIQLQNDQTQGVFGVAPNDLPATTVPVQATVSDKPAVQNGAYSLNGGTLSAPATNMTGSFTQSGGASTFASVIGGGSVTVSGGSLVLSPGATTNVVGSLAISGTGKVDLTSAKLAVNYTGSTPANSIRLALLAGSASGWTGATGLTSSDAAAHTAASYAIGYAEASLVLGPSGGTWNGASVDGTALLLKETYFGDANLDGKVDADDLVLLDRGFNKHPSAGSARWTDGDFNYDGSVTSADYLLADTSFAQHGTPLSAEFLAAREAQFGEGYVASLVAAVPEPTSLGLVGMAAMGLFGRRRRSAK